MHVRIICMSLKWDMPRRYFLSPRPRKTQYCRGVVGVNFIKFRIVVTVAV